MKVIVLVLVGFLLSLSQVACAQEVENFTLDAIVDPSTAQADAKLS